MTKIITIVLCGLLAACTADTTETEGKPAKKEKIEEPQGTPESLADRQCPEESYLTFEDFGGPFMFTWCNGCHASGLPEGMRQDATLGVDFDTIDEIRAWSDRIWARAGDHNVTMPPIGGPDDVEREMLGEWLACGAETFDDQG